MNEHDATEIAYNNGYADGKRDACKWVSVTERRPNGNCLAISMLPGQAYKEMLVGRIAKAEEWETGYVCVGDAVILPNVTHWMQPEPPEDDSNAKM